MARDEIYREEQGMGVSPFVFDEKVVSVFEDMIRRSVPGYELTLTAIAAVAGREVISNSRVYDLGCSLGAGLRVLAGSLAGTPGVEIIGVDPSEAMLAKAGELLADLPMIELVKGKAGEIPMEKASLIVLNFTLQFVPVEQREALLKQCFQALRPGGVLLLSEKFVSDDSDKEDWLRELHWQFKRQQGYSELEIAGKREALENVLLPESQEVHEERLQACGFDKVVRILQCLNFATWVARKK